MEKNGRRKIITGISNLDEFSIKKIKDGKQSNFINGILYWNPSNNEVLANYTKNK